MANQMSVEFLRIHLEICGKLKQNNELETHTMKILVCGGGGFLGSVIVPLLLKKYYKVRVIDIGLFGLDGLKDVENHNNLEIICDDICKIDYNMVRSCDVIIDLAAFSNDPMADKYPRGNKLINIEGTRNLVNIAQNYGIPLFLYASSASVYDGIFESIPLTENANVMPRRGYAYSKYESEKITLNSNIKCPVVVRKGTLYGFSPRMRYDLVVNTMLAEALTKGQITCFCKGEQCRPLLSVIDAANGYLSLIEAQENKIDHEIFNLAHKNYTIKEVALIIKKTIKEYMNINIDVIINDDLRVDRSYKINYDKIFNKIGFKTSDNISDSIKFMCDQIYDGYDFNNPLYYNIKWINNVLNVQNKVGKLNFSEIFI
jgi:nucleoside-diphosphate-sugar epimerase